MDGPCPDLSNPHWRQEGPSTAGGSVFPELLGCLFSIPQVCRKDFQGHRIGMVHFWSGGGRALPPPPPVCIHICGVMSNSGPPTCGDVSAGHKVKLLPVGLNVAKVHWIAAASVSTVLLRKTIPLECQPHVPHPPPPWLFHLTFFKL